MSRHYKFFRKDLNQWITAPEEEWQWEAYYENGTILKQFGDDGIFHQFSEIDQSQLAMFKMTSPSHPHSYTLLLSDPGMKLIHFYRNTILNAGTPSQKRSRLYCFGYEKKVGQKTQKLIMAITPTKGLLITENPDLIIIGNE